MSALNQYLEKIPTEQHELVRMLHLMIVKAVPNLDISLKWGNLTYHAEQNVCAVVAHKQHVNLQLWGGTSLNDPRGLLKGTGKTMRHVELLADAEIDWKYISGLVKQAARAAN
ncbi:MAG: DUF1801 domain-containing protein [Burkholderiales bacterium]